MKLLNSTDTKLKYTDSLAHISPPALLFFYKGSDFMSQGLIQRKKRNAKFNKAKPSANRHILKWDTLSFFSIIILHLVALSY